MDDNHKQILADSTKVIGKLHLLATFFEDDVIYKIYVRSQVIHRMFEQNPELDINKLNLYHLQFTESVLELLRRIKKTNEKNVSLLEDEVRLNKDLALKISEDMRTEQNFEFGKQKQTQKISQALEKLYLNLSDLSKDFPFAKNISQFGGRYAQDYFYEISLDLHYDLITFEADDVYKNGYAIIEQKLMGLQCKHKFNNKFYCGLKSGGLLLEVYQMIDEDVYFVFYPARHLFLICDYERIAHINPSEGLSKRAKVVIELTEKNIVLERQAITAKTAIPEDIEKLLNEYYEKINGMDFMDFMDDFDIQANILKAMLDTESM